MPEAAKAAPLLPSTASGAKRHSAGPRGYGIAVGLLMLAGLTAAKLVFSKAIGEPTPFLLYFGAVLVGVGGHRLECGAGIAGERVGRDALARAGEARLELASHAGAVGVVLIDHGHAQLPTRAQVRDDGTRLKTVRHRGPPQPPRRLVRGGRLEVREHGAGGRHAHQHEVPLAERSPDDSWANVELAPMELPTTTRSLMVQALAASSRATRPAARRRPSLVLDQDS